MDDGEFSSAASAHLPEEKGQLLGLLHRFTLERLSAAERCRHRALELLGGDGGPDRARPELHAFLRECWEALDGLAREVNLCMESLFPCVGLFPPLEMSRQCTFYVVRKRLHEHPDTADHPVSSLLWERTRERPDEAYRRLSFLYNLSLFVPLPLPDGALPGTPDVPQVTAGVIKPASMGRCGIVEGTEAILNWLGTFAAECRRRLSRALSETNG